MVKEPFNAEEYEAILKRVNQLKSRVALDSGPEQDNAKRLLERLLKRLEDYKETHDAPRSARTQNGNPDHTQQQARANPNPQQCRTPEQMYEEFGILYLIFGGTYETQIYGHCYKLVFVRKAPDDEPAFYRVHAKLYEDGKLICNNIIVGFWPWDYGGTRCEDMEFGIYDKGYIKDAPYMEISCKLRDIWNYFFDHLTRLEGRSSRHVGSSTTSLMHKKW